MVTLFFNYFNVKYIPIYLILAIVTISSSLYLFQNDNVLRNRLLDNYGNSNSDTENVGSGRLVFQVASFHIWSEGTVTEKLWGIGLNEYKDKMLKKLGLRIYAHNGFVSALVKDGIIGFILYFYFIGYMVFIAAKSRSPFRVLALSFSLSYLSYQIVQGNIISQIMEVLLGAIFVLVYAPLSTKIKKRESKVALAIKETTYR